MTKEAIDTNTLGSRIEHARTTAELDRDALGAMIGKSGKTISHYEKGTNSPTFDTIQAISTALTVDPNHLCFGNKAEQADNDNNNDDPKKDIESKDDTEQTEDVSKLDAQLAQLAEMEFDGSRKSKNKAMAHIKLIHVETDELSFEDALEYAEQYELADFDNISEPLNELGVTYLVEPSENEVNSLKDKIVQEIVERLIDQALLDEDLYSLDFNMLDDFSEDHSIYPNRFWSFAWRGHKELVPAIREKVREIVLSGELPWEIE